MDLILISKKAQLLKADFNEESVARGGQRFFGGGEGGCVTDWLCIPELRAGQ